MAKEKKSSSNTTAAEAAEVTAAVEIETTATESATTESAAETVPEEIEAVDVIAEEVPAVEGGTADSAAHVGDDSDLVVTEQSEQVVTEAVEAAEASEPAVELSDATAPEQEAQEAQEAQETEAESYIFGCLEKSGLKGIVIASGAFHASKAKALLNDVAEGKLDYVIVASSLANGVDRAVLVSTALFQQLNELAGYSVVAQPVSWLCGAPSFSRDALFVNRTAHAVGDFSVGRASSASALVQGLSKLYGYVVSAADFHSSFSA